MYIKLFLYEYFNKFVNDYKYSNIILVYLIYI